MDALLKKFEDELKNILNHLQEELRGVRSNRPSVQLLEDVRVDYYGQPMTVKQLGSLSIQPPRDILVSVWDKAAVGAVSKAIETTKAGFSVSTDGNVIRVSLPPLTDERRAELTKLVKKMAEETRISIRGQRDEMMKKIKTAEDGKEISEDAAFRYKEKAQKMVEDTNKGVETATENKLRELSE